MTFIKGVIKRLKKRYPTSLDIYKTTSRSPDLETGRETKTRIKIHISKALFIPQQVAFQLSQAVGPISSGMNFGGFLPSDLSTVIVDETDLKGTVLNIEDCAVIIKKIRYEITKIVPLPDAQILTVKALFTAKLE